MSTIQQALADPNSSIHGKLSAFAQAKADNDKVIAAWMAKGLTREQAYKRALFG